MIKEMRPKARGALIKKIVEIAKLAVSDPKQVDWVDDTNSVPSPEEPFRSLRWIQAENVSFGLGDVALQKYEELLKQLLTTEKWNEKFSESYLDNVLQKIIASSLTEDLTATVERLFDQLCNDFYLYNRDHVVYLPLSGITLHRDIYAIGNIELAHLTETVIAEMLETVRTIILLSPSTPKQQEANHGWFKQRLESLKGAVCARYTIVAEPERAVERALEEVRSVFDLLRYAIPVIYPFNTHVAIGLQGEVISRIRTTPVFALDNQSFTLSIVREGAFQPFKFSEETIERMEQLGVFKVAAILKRPHQNRTDFERTLLRGIHWFATAQTQVEQENKVLNLITCLEAFLSAGQFIGNSVTIGTARLLVTDLEKRRKIKKRLQGLYGVRSGLSHGEEKEVLDHDVIELQAIAGNFLFQMIEKIDKFQTKKGFLAWIEEQQLI